VPARATVKLAARLVPDQSPDVALDVIKRHAYDIRMLLMDEAVGGRVLICMCRGRDCGMSKNRV
jgi:hypothetical protein